MNNISAIITRGKMPSKAEYIEWSNLTTAGALAFLQLDDLYNAE